ncbi:MAG: hypothetical protein JJ953_07650 [Gracilimonas sp.]|uniref:hypothetical protein n=1 Tax=Gracilimonas TaxID=649462 RepID=UPI001B1A301E|nr:hypothetical protein [Gracilimonas sp.]MBO6585959.1 hypothetical protein [Gracilimonas sp.]MBO6616956.1 hypothetical protein [Gracilimonas sp.]
MSIMVLNNMGILLLTGVLKEAQIYSDMPPEINYTIPELIISAFMLVICIYALFKLFTQPRVKGDFKLMRCPECGEEPYKIWKWSGPGVDFKKRMQGFMTCIHCGSYLRKIHSRVFYTCIFVMSLSYLIIFSIPLYLSFESQLGLILSIFAVFGGLMVISSLIALYLLIARTRFVQVVAKD